MKKRILMTATAILLSLSMLAGCGNKNETPDTSTEQQRPSTEKSTEDTTDTSTQEVENTQTQKPNSTETDVPETTEKPGVSTESTESTEGNSSTQKPSDTPTPSPTPEPTPEPAPTPTPSDAPIVTKEGTVNDADYQKAVSAFENIVKKMRTDGLVKSTDACVTMDSTTLKVDITFDNNDIDLTLKKDSNTNIYTLTLDYDFTWLEGFGPTVNGKDPAIYNKELLIAALSTISDEPNVVFDRIDQDCFSAFGLYSDKWIQIADCSLMSGPMEVNKYISYYLTKEDVDTRDASYTLTGTSSGGKTIECVIEYVSSKENLSNFASIKTGCTSYENYKNNLLDSFIAKGDPNASITEYTSHRVNGYTYYWLEGFYKTENSIGDPDIVYVQIGENEYLELYGILFEERFEDFINSSFYIKEIRVK